MEEFEEFKDIVHKIIDANPVVIVEGKKDRRALESFGIKNIIELSKKPIFEIVEQIANSSKECVILTDLDKEGKEMYSKLSSNLQKHGVKIDNRIREFLFKKTKLRQIEGIDSYFN